MSRSAGRLAWALCWVAIALLTVGTVLGIAYPESGDEGVLYAVVPALGFALVPPVGALIATRLPRNPYGWLWCAGGLTFGVLPFSDGLRRSGAIDVRLADVLGGAAFVTGIGGLVFVLLLFPTGRLPSRRWRWLGRAALLVTAVNLVALPFGPSVLLDRGVEVVFLLIVAAAASLLVRFRRAGPVERQQLKWFFAGAVVAAATTGLDVLGVFDGSPVWALLDALSVPLLPATVGIAVLRYRLYDIDRIVSRTVSYGLLTAGLIGLYLLVVALLRPLLEPVTGSSALAVAGSTLAVAAAFNPARRRLQDLVDRRFDRARYDAAQAVEDFAARLRDQVDLGEIETGLRRTISATVAPARIGLWLRDTPGGAA